MNDKNGFALVRKPSGAVEKAAPGARRIISGMVADTLALVKKPSLRIIILDDEPMLLEIYELMIRGFCKEVTLLKFRNPWEALQELLRVAPDLLITDMCHGGLEGREMLPLLAQKKVGFPILVISGTIDEETVRQCAGPELNVFYMWKPVQFEEFLTVFATALKIPRNIASRDKTMSRKTAIDPAKLESWFQNGVSCFESKNYTEAVKWYRMAAEQNHANAQNNLGECYYDGQGVEKDYEEAVKWCRKAAEQGHMKAQNIMGVCYQNGWGVSQDHAEAVEWYLKAAEQGLGVAKWNISFYYYKGQGVTEHYKEAVVKRYRKDAEQGDMEAQNIMGVCYYNDYGVEKDYEEAVKWFRKAAEQGQATAQSNLGFCYEKGHGIPLNLVEAHKFYKLATAQNQKNAVKNLERIMTRMTADEIAEGEHRVREFRSRKI